MANREYQLWWVIQDLIGDAKLWPYEMRRLFWTRGLDHWERLKVAAFVFINGLEPTLFLEWVQLKGMADSPASLTHFEYLLNRM